MALVGTISGSNGTSNTAITGTLVVANTSTSFPRIPSDPADTVLYAQGSIVASNEIHASGNIRLMNSTGDEGGEIFLNKPVTNTTLAGGVTVDVYQNRLRFFEQGGTARGYFLDITNGGSAASTNLGAAGGSPGGSDTHVQFNDGGSFGGQSSFKFNKTSEAASISNLFVTGSNVGSLVSSGTFLIKDGAGSVVASISTGGVISGSGDLQIGGNITGSNLYLSGDVAVVGGDISTTAATFNLVTGSATTVNFAGSATAIRVGASNSILSLTGTVDLSGSAATTLARITGGDLDLSSASRLRLGTASNMLIFHNGSNFAMTNGTGHLSLNNNAVNQRIEMNLSSSVAAGMVRVRRVFGPAATPTIDNLFEVRADGSVMIGSGTSGSGLANTTINNDVFLNTGRILVSSDTTPISMVSSGNFTLQLDVNNNGSGHKFSVQDWRSIDQLTVFEEGNTEVSGSLIVSGTTSLVTVNERLFPTASNGGVVNFNMLDSSIFHVNNPLTANITANFTGLPATNNRAWTPTIILSQSATPRIINAVQVGGSAFKLNWANNVEPTGNANKHDVFGFSLIRSGGNWTVLGQMTTYG